MKTHCLSLVLALALVQGQVLAETPQPPPVAVEAIADLSGLLQIDDVIDVMREEGISYGANMENDMFPGQGGSSWQATVAVIYDPDVMRMRFDQALATALGHSSDVEAISTFFASELGQRVVSLEIAARRALLDDAAEEAAKLAYAEMVAENAPRVAALQAFVEVNDLIESNVIGSMNANLAFYQGLAEVGSFSEAMPEDQMLADVWASEADMRAETIDWLYPYLALAYKPLSAADLQAYQDFSTSDAGQTVNAALFAAFDAVFVGVSIDLGRAAALQMQGQDL